MREFALRPMGDFLLVLDLLSLPKKSGSSQTFHTYEYKPFIFTWVAISLSLFLGVMTS